LNQLDFYKVEIKENVELTFGPGGESAGYPWRGSFLFGQTARMLGACRVIS